MAKTKRTRVAEPLPGLNGFGMRCLHQRLEDCSGAVEATLQGLYQARVNARASTEEPDERLDQIEKRLTGALEQLTAAQGELTAAGAKRAGRSVGGGR